MKQQKKPLFQKRSGFVLKTFQSFVTPCVNAQKSKLPGLQKSRMEECWEKHGEDVNNSQNAIEFTDFL